MEITVICFQITEKIKGSRRIPLKSPILKQTKQSIYERISENIEGYVYNGCSCVICLMTIQLYVTENELKTKK